MKQKCKKLDCIIAYNQEEGLMSENFVLDTYNQDGLNPSDCFNFCPACGCKIKWGYEK